jgi:cyanophycin synthetase
MHPRVEAAVLETARGGILREGLAFDSCTVGVVTNVSSDHLGLGGVHSLEQLARVKQVVVESVSRHGTAVLNAEDRLVAEMAAATRGRTMYFARHPDHPVLAPHVAEGGVGVTVDDGWIVLREGATSTPIVELERVPLTADGRIGFQVENVLAATAAAWAAGVNPAFLARGLSTFGAQPLTVPGRFNRLDLGGVEVVLDYAHNTAAMVALGEALHALGRRRTWLVMGLPGDRRDEDLKGTVEATRSFASAWILHDLTDRRGRAPDEVPRLLCASVPDNAICKVVASSKEGVELALKHARPGDRVVVIADVVDELLSTLPALGFRTASDLACSGATG